MPKGITLNTGRYVDFLMQLHKNIRNRRKGKLSAEVILLRGNVRLLSVSLTQSMLNTTAFRNFASSTV